ncbi:hypothetical protein EVAR_60930_1 [Eumeta japonica]|uniref:Uncharacterized protein n=1 Tax=Eumeta variegata TaxID=151549 RepID=A0A4C1ZCC0_EUMVA|nr:hypothetical protein EVAR_60930_1 [Eumeta japonica]
MAESDLIEAEPIADLVSVSALTTRGHHYSPKMEAQEDHRDLITTLNVDPTRVGAADDRRPLFIDNVQERRIHVRFEE